jgi:nuclear polyadenylated RNA-binding protein NAB2
MVSVAAPQTGSMNAPSPHKTVIFNKASQSKALGAKAQAIEDEKNSTIQAVKEAEEAAAKKDNSKRTPIAA